MKRRTLLAAGVLPPMSVFGKWLNRLLLANRGKVLEKQVTAFEGSETQELVRITDEGSEVADDIEALLGEEAGELSTRQAEKLRAQYDAVRFHVTVAHHTSSHGGPDDGSPVEYKTSRMLYSGMNIGDHISFQTSLIRGNSIISLSCLAKDKKSLQPRCRVGVDGPNDEEPGSAFS
ncbi:hypothetical protein Har1131_18145 [Haloarcula sp. CBA1131]|uniref:hypothetical protein n=1 Tax=Haloarcula sp. CBA1131 TaxID=1853686 RepID=UPI001248E1A6|nr:hypothetical protein [Haloarcula sp. CBA1131]KAA9400617.1 hypothetical protein Har1131_18145 [Haloarcula sp. CBA1131]